MTKDTKKPTPQAKNGKTSENKQKNRKSFQKHFRKFHEPQTTGHPSYVYDEKGNVYKVLGLTSSETTNNVLNIKLEKNPEPGNTKKSYIRPNPIEIKKGTKNRRLKDWELTKADKKKVNKIITKK